MKKTAATTLATAALLLATGTSYAAVTGYVGGAIGQSDPDVSGFDKATSWQLFGGANLTQYIAIEAAYTDLGEFDISGTSNSYNDVTGVELTAVGNFPISDAVSIFAEAGAFSWNLDATRSGADAGSDDGTDLTYGVGVKFGLMQTLRVHLEYQAYQDVSGADINTFYGGLAFGF